MRYQGFSTEQTVVSSESKKSSNSWSTLTARSSFVIPHDAYSPICDLDVILLRLSDTLFGIVRCLDHE